MLCGPEERATAKEIKNHRWLKGVDWPNIRQQVSPFVPHVILSSKFLLL